MVKQACDGAAGFIADRSKTFGVLRALGRLTVNSRLLGSMAYFFQHPVSARDMVYDDGNFRAVFLLKERLAALNLKDARIREALRVILESLRLNNEKVRKNNIEFYVLLIPTKELVFKDVIDKNYASPRGGWCLNPYRLCSTWTSSQQREITIPEDYKELTGNEENIFKQAKAYLQERGIRYIDALPALRECLTRGKQPYSVTPDGHPNAAGYNAIARLVDAALREKQKN